MVVFVVLSHENPSSRQVLVFLHTYENTTDQAPFASLIVHLPELLDVVGVADGATRNGRKPLGLSSHAPVFLEAVGPCASIVCPR